MLCPHCRFDVKPGVRQCPVCGVAVGPAAGPSSRRAAPPPERRGVSPMVIASACVAAISAGVIVAVLLNRSSRPPLRPLPEPRGEPVAHQAPPPPVEPARPPVAPPPAPAPVPTPAPPPDAPAGLDRILTAADEQFKRGRLLYEEGHSLSSENLLNEAGFAAEEARNKYQVLVDGFSGAKRGEVQEKLTQANQLLKLIGDAKKGIAGRREPPPSAVAPPPPPTSPPPPAPAPAPTAKLPPASAPQTDRLPPPPSPWAKPPIEPGRTPPPPPPSRTPAPPAPPPPEPPKGPSPAALRAIELLKDFVALPTTDKIEALRSAALGSAPDARDHRPLVEAAAVWLDSLKTADAFAPSAERKALLELIKAEDPASFPSLGIEQLAAALDKIAAAVKGLPADEGELLRLWGWAHLARLSKLGAPDSHLDRWASGLGLDTEMVGPQRYFGTAGGLAVLRLREAANFDEADELAKRSKLGSKENYDACAAFTLLRHWYGFSTALQLEKLDTVDKAFRKVRPPERFADVFRHVAAKLKEADPCRQCKGEGLVKCPSCVDGQATFMCNGCNGYGSKLVAGGRPVPCRDCNQRGKWTDKCPKCKGTGKRECPRCSGKAWAPPPADKVAGQLSCGVCSASGLVLSPLAVPCRECMGLGRKPYKP
jgi:hypothetical protein